MAATIHNELAKIEHLDMAIKIGSTSTTLLIDSGSACSILNQSLAMQNCVRKTAKLQLQVSSNEPV